MYHTHTQSDRRTDRICYNGKRKQKKDWILLHTHMSMKYIKFYYLNYTDDYDYDNDEKEYDDNAYNVVDDDEVDAVVHIVYLLPVV